MERNHSSIQTVRGSALRLSDHRTVAMTRDSLSAAPTDSEGPGSAAVPSEACHCRSAATATVRSARTVPVPGLCRRCYAIRSLIKSETLREKLN